MTKITVRLSEPIIAAIVVEANNWYPKETGGVLMGYWANDHEVVISGIVGPGPNALHTYNSFIPDDTYHISEIARLYTESKGEQTYLGDWHTHPNAEAYLSERDRKTLRKIADYKPARLKRPLMLVFGTEPMEIKSWLHEFKGLLRFSSIKSCKVEHI